MVPRTVWRMDAAFEALKNSGILKDKFGYWPSFHDAEILSVVLDRIGPSLLLRVLSGHYKEAGEKMAFAGYFEVVLRFEDIDNLVLDSFNHQNVISFVQVSSITEERFATGKVEDRLKVEVSGIFGANCNFSCREGSVVSVEESKEQLGKPGER